MKKRAALILDNLKLSKWQLDALDAASDAVEIVLVLNCQNTNTKKKYVKNFLYYALNLFSLRNRLTRKKKVSFPSAVAVSFESVYVGSWQSLPEEIYKEMESEGVEVVIKFGMGLLRLDDVKLLPPILSYHHGDPSKYRGRPAGFYEIINGEKTTGIVIQTLSNRLDAGEIYAFAESKVVDFSYKRTAINFYSNSIPLLSSALTNLSTNSKIEVAVNGKNYRLPSNLKVMRFLFFLALNALKKIAYGLFFEKRWRVATTKNTLNLMQAEVLPSVEFEEVPIDKKYNFYADPFFSEDGRSIRLEALDNKTGLGDILEFTVGDYAKKVKIISGEHFSYPCSFLYEEREYLLPEVASHSAQFFFELSKVDEKYFLKGLENKRIVDATMHLKGDECYLFFGESKSAQTVLNLWVAKSPFDEFKPHPKSPIVISPSEARMGGKLLIFNEKILRFGQNNSGEYGASLAVMQVTNLTADGYEEVKLGSITIDNFSGPHSIGFNFDRTRLLIDYYSNEFSPFAGFRRIKSRLQRK